MRMASLLWRLDLLLCSLLCHGDCDEGEEFAQKICMQWRRSMGNFKYFIKWKFFNLILECFGCLNVWDDDAWKFFSLKLKSAVNFSNFFLKIFFWKFLLFYWWKIFFVKLFKFCSKISLLSVTPNPAG